ncbi:hypothetical protein [Teredinibacter franksiae]|uniref:hypothetical protein n=1 Tax=Teredinibacter franksiae TaxID=2761453 RepID=UPI001623E047|nr:hypothetical protein [Teredinibacter franksiae]
MKLSVQLNDDIHPLFALYTHDQVLAQECTLTEKFYFKSVLVGSNDAARQRVNILWLSPTV